MKDEELTASLGGMINDLMTLRDQVLEQGKDPFSVPIAAVVNSKARPLGGVSFVRGYAVILDAETSSRIQEEKHGEQYDDDAS